LEEIQKVFLFNKDWNFIEYFAIKEKREINQLLIKEKEKEKEKDEMLSFVE
jgi:hypothetical protein